MVHFGEGVWIIKTRARSPVALAFTFVSAICGIMPRLNALHKYNSRFIRAASVYTQYTLFPYPARKRKSALYMHSLIYVYNAQNPVKFVHRKLCRAARPFFPYLFFKLKPPLLQKYRCHPPRQGPPRWRAAPANRVSKAHVTHRHKREPRPGPKFTSWRRAIITRKSPLAPSNLLFNDRLKVQPKRLHDSRAEEKRITRPLKHIPTYTPAPPVPHVLRFEEVDVILDGFVGKTLFNKRRSPPKHEITKNKAHNQKYEKRGLFRTFSLHTLVVQQESTF